MWADITKVLFSFNKGTAGGPSGLCPDHLVDAVRVKDSSDVGAQLNKLVAFLVASNGPPEVKPFLAGARLLAWG